VTLGLTVAIMGGAGVLTGQALARNWRPVWQVFFACFGLGLANRFFVYALFDGPLISLAAFVFDTAVITAMALIAYRISRVSKIVRQYPWLYERSNVFGYRRKH